MNKFLKKFIKAIEEAFDGHRVIMYIFLNNSYMM